jgi:hypothetical protein
VAPEKDAVVNPPNLKLDTQTLGGVTERLLD